jgi:hypothetical protein
MVVISALSPQAFMRGSTAATSGGITLEKESVKWFVTSLGIVVQAEHIISGIQVSLSTLVLGCILAGLHSPRSDLKWKIYSSTMFSLVLSVIFLKIMNGP